MKINHRFHGLKNIDHQDFEEIVLDNVNKKYLKIL